MDPNQLAGLMQGTSDLVTGLDAHQVQHYTAQQNQWHDERRKEKLKGLSKQITPCDGEVSAQTRNYLYDIELLRPQLQGDYGDMIYIVGRTACGALRREIERYLATQQVPRDQVPWNQLKTHIERLFLSTDEQEKLRVYVEQLNQREGETLASYNRRFREAVERAYPAPRSADADRIVLRNYLKGLRSSDLAKKASLELPQQTLDAALTFTEGIEAGLERYQGLQRDEPMDTSSLQKEPSPNQETIHEVLQMLRTVKKGQDNLVTRINKLKKGGRHQGSNLNQSEGS